MDLKKGLSLVAFGFLFTVVNLNLTLNGTTVNVMPEFIGWLLIFLACFKLGSCTADRPYLKWLALALAMLHAVAWGCAIPKPELDLGPLANIYTVLSAVCMFFLLEALEKLARDLGSPRERALSVLKILDPALLLGFLAAGLAGGYTGSESLSLLTVLLGIAALIAPVVTAIVLFMLRRDLRNAD